MAELRDIPGWGTTGDVLFISAGGYHHHLGVQHVEVRRRTTRSPTASPDCTTSRSCIRRAPTWPTPSAGCRPSTGRCASSTDHGTHEAIYISDPDGNDLELYWDRPQAEWPLDEQGHVAFGGGELDLEDLLATA